jgi:hypothetical protein
MFASTVNEEPSEVHNQGHFVNQSKLYFFSSINKVSFQLEEPTMTQVAGYQKYVIPFLYL